MGEPRFLSPGSPMRRAALLVLAVLTAVSGCTNPHAHKPAAEFGPGITPITTRVPRKATYTLVSLDQRDAPPLLTVEAPAGARIGFRREPDRTVTAVAIGQEFPLPDGRFAWVMVPGSDPDRRECLREDCHSFGEGMKNCLFMAGVGLLVVSGVVLYALCQSNTGF